MRRESAVITPQFICSYAWKQPPARPALFQRAQKLLTRENLGADTSQAGPWKAFLASRERQLLASDIVEGFFSAPRDVEPSSMVRPSILTSKLPANRPAKGLLASVLTQEASQEPTTDAAADLQIAA
jgi:hypothetical protein